MQIKRELQTEGRCHVTKNVMLKVSNKIHVYAKRQNVNSIGPYRGPAPGGGGGGGGGYWRSVRF